MIAHLLHALLWAAAGAALLASAWQDLKARTIPDKLVWLVAASGLGLSLLLRAEQLWISLLAAFLLILALGVLAHFRVMGGGDVKLLGAASLLAPPADIPALLVFTMVAGGALSAAYLIARQVVRRRRPARACGKMGEARGTWLSRECARIAADCPVPYAVAIVGGVAAVASGEVQRCLYGNFCSF